MSILTLLKHSSLTLLTLSVVCQNRAVAQVVPDNTLGRESSQFLNISPLNQLIRGGAVRGDNLFHSFKEFSIGTGERVTFINPVNPVPIQRVFSRVTGNSRSEILGTLASTGNADLYFLNPNGIVFGPKAQLDVGGSFVASTANAFKFGDTYVYSARNPEVPSSLLTILPSALQFGQIPPGGITVQSKAGGTGLRVPTGESLVLLGGPVTVDRGYLTAWEGRVEVGAAQNGIVQISPNGQLTFTAGSAQERVIFQNGARATVSFRDKGDIQVTGRTIDILESQLIAGITILLGATTSQAGNVILTATESVKVREGFILNNISRNNIFRLATGNGGNIEITAPIIELLKGGQLQAITTGRGNVGNIIINANERVTVAGENDTGAPSGAFNVVLQDGAGNGGNVEIDTAVLEVLNGGELAVNIHGTGNAGNIIIDADKRVTITGERTNGSPSGIFSLVQESGIGNSGNVEVNTTVLELRNGGLIQSSNVGRGNVGSIIIDVDERVTVTGEGGTGAPSRIASLIGPGVIGNGGNVEIDTVVLEVLDGAALRAETFGRGNSGNVIINASEAATFSGDGSLGNSVASSSVRAGGTGNAGNVEISTAVLRVLNGAQLGSGTFGQGNAGDVIINARDRATFIGEDTDGNNSGAFSSVEKSGRGSGGNVEINTTVLEVLNGANLSASTRGQGDAGSVIINARETVTLTGEGRDGSSSGAFSSVEKSGIGSGGNIEIDTVVLKVLDGAQLLANTAGEGNAGNVIINASEAITFAGAGTLTSGAFSSVAQNGAGRGGDIEISTSVLEVLGGAVLSASTASEGDAGNVIINANDRVTFSGGGSLIPGGVRFLSGAASLVTEDGVGSGGNIEITTSVLELLDGATLSAATRGEGDAGSIIIDSHNYVDLDQGKIRTDSSSVSGGGGDISIKTPLLILTDQSQILTQTVSTDGGNITLNLDNLLALTDNSLISTEAGTASAGGDGGNITINTQFIVSRLVENSDIVADAFDGDGGNVNITATGGIFGIVPRPLRTPESDITASSRNGVSGTIAIQSPNVDPNQSATELPTALDVPTVVQSCREAYVQAGSEFVVTGRGGLPQGPLDSASAALWQDVLPIESGDHGHNQQASPERENPAAPAASTFPEPIVEIQGWTKNELGQIVLVAEDPQQATVGQPLTCQG